MYKFFDTHAHYNMEPLCSFVDEHFNNPEFAVCVIGTNTNDSIEAIRLAKLKTNIYASVGIHPNESKNIKIDEEIAKLELMINDNLDIISAIGECGLDYHYDNYDINKQHKLFREQILLALKYKLTLVLHIRDAHDDAKKILDEFNLESINVIIHCYTSDKETLKKYVDKGFYISIPGVVTFKNANYLRESIFDIPKDRLLTETDSPYLSPVPLRGTINNSTNIRYINEYIANILNVNYETLNNQLVKNALVAYNIKLPK